MSLKSFLQKVDHQLGVKLLSIKYECDCIQYNAPKIEVDNSRLYRRGKY